jgi:HAD superfamily hydrolase (TIGR01509 family)
LKEAPAVRIIPHDFPGRRGRGEGGMIRGLIFDFDGLILDTELPAFRAWEEICLEHGCPLPLELWASCIGTSWKFDVLGYLEGRLGRELDRPALAARHHRRELELISQEEPLPGVRDYIAGAKRLGLKLGLASSSSRAWVVHHLARLGLEREFDSIKCAEDVGRAKPDPDLYRAVLAELALEPEEALALEDSPNGVLAARRAGLFCVAVPNPLTSRLPLDGADLLLDSLASLPLEALLREVQRKRGR